METRMPAWAIPPNWGLLPVAADMVKARKNAWEEVTRSRARRRRMGRPRGRHCIVGGRGMVLGGSLAVEEILPMQWVGWRMGWGKGGDARRMGNEHEHGLDPASICDGRALGRGLVRVLVGCGGGGGGA